MDLDFQVEMPPNPGFVKQHHVNPRPVNKRTGFVGSIRRLEPVKATISSS
jgi:hypothetical protein